MFKPFPKVPRLSRDVVVTEKIDGTNASVWVVNGQLVKHDRDFPRNTLLAEIDGMFLFAGSRTRFIHPDQDNFGFAKWVADHAQELIEGLGEGTHHGEWWGSGIQRKYGLKNGERRFSLFNTSRWGMFGNDDVRPRCCHVVPVLYRGSFDTTYVYRTMSLLKETGSHAAPGFMNPEGVMIYHTAALQFFKKTFEGDQYGKESSQQGEAKDV
jgi:hypothetical protein